MAKKALRRRRKKPAKKKIPVLYVWGSKSGHWFCSTSKPLRRKVYASIKLNPDKADGIALRMTNLFVLHKEIVAGDALKSVKIVGKRVAAMHAN